MLPLDEIAVCPAVFQPRAVQDHDGLDARHIEALVAALGSKPADARVLDPIMVFAVGNRFYVLDGHHRHAAYHEVGGADLVPVQHFEGSIDEAVSEALRINAKVHLNMSREERNGAAWRLVVQAEAGGGQRLSGVKIVAISGLSLSTINRMKALCRRLMDQDKGGEWDCPPLPETVWEDHRAALRADRGATAGGDPDAWLDAMVAKWADTLGKAFGDEGHKHPGLFGKALMEYLGEHDFGRMAEEQEFVAMDGETHEAFLEWQYERAILTGT
ncbi:MAG: ParB N-terminal domain-containing protein [Pararhizobium sp.]